MQKHRRCPNIWPKSDILYDSYYCELPDDGHNIHVYTCKLNGEFMRVQWCDQKYKDLL